MGAQRNQPKRALASSIDPIAESWGLPDLGERVTLRVSRRLRRSLGSYHSGRAEITLAAWLFDAPSPLLDEVLCHEAAHAAVHFLHGRGARPHGREWRDLMAKAGFEPRVRIPFSELPESHRKRLSRSPVWEHRCPVCQATRLARTRVTRWRCTSCRAAGRSGELVIERVPAPIPVDA